MSACDFCLKTIAEACCIEGEFVLKSGRRSNYYIDKYRLISDPGVTALIVAELVTRVPDMNGIVIAGQELGGAVLASHVAVRVNARCILVRKKTKEYGTQKRIEGIVKEGDKVCLIEDVATTGGSIVDTIGVLKEAGAGVVQATAVVDRNEGSREALAELGVPYGFLYSAESLVAAVGIVPRSEGP